MIKTIWEMLSVSNSSNPLEWFRVKVGTGTKLLQQVFAHESLDHSKSAGFTNKNPASEVHNFSSNQVCEFWLYRDMINT